MAAITKLRMELSRYLVMAEELAIALESDIAALAAVTNGGITAETLRAIRAMVAEIRAIERERREPPRRDVTSLRVSKPENMRLLISLLTAVLSRRSSCIRSGTSGLRRAGGRRCRARPW